MLSTAIINLRPKANFAIVDGEIIWTDDQQEKPTEEEINSEILRLEKEFAISAKREELNKERDKKLSGFIIEGIFLNEEVVKSMAVAYNVAEEGEEIEWINIDNEKIKLTKQELATIIKQATTEIKEIYFAYRELKDQL